MSVRLSGPPASDAGRRVDCALLVDRARRALRALGHTRSELSIALVDDDEIAALNRAHRDRRGPTDVLSFSLLEGDHAPYRGRLLGDVVISVDTARRQARGAHRGFDAELLRLLIHGTLHLLGHDHEGASDARAMRAEERRVHRALLSEERRAVLG